MTIRFQRRVGAAADVAELEYVIALHQTCPSTRANATVSSRDVQRLLLSRYGLKISHDKAIRLVRSLGGGETTAEVKQNRSASWTPRRKRSLPMHRHDVNEDKSLSRQIKVDVHSSVAESITQQSIRNAENGHTRRVEVSDSIPLRNDASKVGEELPEEFLE